VGNTTIPAEFLTSGGIGDATRILQDFHKQALTESNKTRELENEVIMQLTGLRSDLQQKIKEIKSLSSDFKNSVDKEMEGSRKAVRHLQEALGLVDTDPAATAGKGDPFIVKLGVDRQIERHIEEENYLHRVGIPVLFDFHFSDSCRHILIWNPQAVNLNRSLLVRSKKHIPHTRAYLNVKRTKLSRRPRDFEEDHSRWPKIMNGMSSSLIMITWSIQESQSDLSTTSRIQERIIQLQQKSEVVCSSERASTSRIILQDGKWCIQWIFILDLCDS
jgi:hypothetical protein